MRTEGSAQNLLGVLRRAKPRNRVDQDEDGAGDFIEIVPAVDGPAVSAAESSATHAGMPCPVELCIPNVIYCQTHRPAYDATSRRRLDRHGPIDDAALFDPGPTGE